jgi:hypothetical protein
MGFWHGFDTVGAVWEIYIVVAEYGDSRSVLE